MDSKLSLLKSLNLLRKIPDEQLSLLGEKLKPLTLPDGAVLFEEGSQGTGMYFVSEGKIKISKLASGGVFNDLAILPAGAYFGEGDLVGATKRSARASADGAAVVMELAREDMQAWLKANHSGALAFYAELAQIQSARLRRTSNELTLFFDLSSLIVERHATPKALLHKAFGHVAPHMEGAWTAAAYLYNPYNDEMERVAAHGAPQEDTLAAKLPKATDSKDVWIDERSYYATLPGPKRPLGYLLFQAASPLSEEERNNTSRILVTVTRLLTAAVENINFQTEEALRARLKAQSYGPGI
jgi:CRP-like cAMP-binding protein